MCGIFAYGGDAPPDPARLAAVARSAGTRGPHACGWEWFGPVRGSGRHLGPIERQIPAMTRRMGRVLIGHARLATTGEVDDTANIQPLVAEGYALAHNGTVPDAAAVCVRYGYAQRTTNDSEALLAVALRTRGSLGDRLHAAVRILPEDKPFAVILTDGEQIATIRRGQPLYWGQEEDGFYFCSRPWRIGQGCALTTEHFTACYQAVVHHG